ncbi:reverse transcriptase (RNA-dependent DNA polymerase) domain-containing protein [Ditylenchus destructor]|uniref:Reverse transcriptase (RNA-dependent DNA polymerase) domain-containing protein n=1 Tax=Ditylenchus destructor TaxID=166010 RepID=A0AAD4N413_9BILA|nr:reverse transcriptase (RNA-dependent DNA polymerase) domain-containing protein [Ditylenchus destructor]
MNERLTVHKKGNSYILEDIRIRVVHKLHDTCPRATRLDAENYWIHQTISIYPFGLNDKFAGNNFLQICGIPQGGNASPILADLTLTAMEFRYMKNCSCTNLKRELSMSFRYIDDILCLSNVFHNEYTKIYGTTLELNKTSENTETAFLGLYIKIKDDEIQYETYDKTRDYKFKVIKYPKFDSCIPKNMAQLFRYIEVSDEQDRRRDNHRRNEC